MTGKFKIDASYMRSSIMFLFFGIFLAGCQTSNVRPNSVAIPEPTSPVYLDVAVIPFHALPRNPKTYEVDYEAVESQGLWPQLRRAESKRFAVQTKLALEKFNNFGKVNVIPRLDPTDARALEHKADAQIGVLGAIIKSNSREIVLYIKVVDTAGAVLGERSFSHEVSPAFFKDKANEGKDSYGPVFKKIAIYVNSLVSKITAKEKQRLVLVSDLQYASMLSPEYFDQYLEVKKEKSFLSSDREVTILKAIPDENDPMLRRAMAIRSSEQMLVSKFQDRFLDFNRKMDDSYLDWQAEAIQYVIEADEQRSERNTAIAIGTLGAILGAKEGLSSTVGALATVTAAGSLMHAMKANEKLKAKMPVIDEMGQNIDFAVSDQVVEFDGEVVSLSGTSAEQLEQWRAHLQKIYDLETGGGKTL